MAVLLIAEMNGADLAQDATAKALGCAKQLGEVTVLTASTGCNANGAQAAAKLEGVTKVLCADDASLGHGLAEPTAALIASIAGDYTHIVAAATVQGKNVLPRVAALLDVMVITDIQGVVDADTFERPIYAGNAIQTVRSSDKIKVLSVRTASFEAVGAQDAAPIESIAVPADPGLSAWVEDSVVATDRPELTSAKVVISGGRGMGNKENFEMIEKVADKLGAATGASRAAVDSGYAPNDWQVGQTGKVVAPELYIAVGISGAIQHLAGMKDSKVIVAINKDEEAPIFQVADYGLVGDLFEVLPKLEEELG
ncbi:MAG: FAD-binding protein [Pseudomonadota bacterium]